MIWTDEWVGIPYQKRGRGPAVYDCLGLFLELQRVRFGREIEDPACSMAQAIRHDAAGTHFVSWEKVSDVKEGDALLFRVKSHPLHLGYAVNSSTMLHTEAEGIGSAVEPFRSMHWKNRLLGVYRYHAKS